MRVRVRSLILIPIVLAVLSPAVVSTGPYDAAWGQQSQSRTQSQPFSDLPPQPSATGDLPSSLTGPPMGPTRVIRSEREWAKILPVGTFRVMRMKATEPAFSGKLVRNHAAGTYICAACNAPLFSSRAKFESGTGWPSFFTPIAAGQIHTAPDYLESVPRVEVMCARCDGHLGHVFSDGPPPTGLRFCMNSVALKFVPESKVKAAAAAASAAAAAKVKAKTKTATATATAEATPEGAPAPEGSSGSAPANPPPTEGSGSSKPAPAP
jgi:peptide-methionine (R)-S-oxide reductase